MSKLPAMRNQPPKPAFAVVWEFRVRPRKRRAFEQAYGPDGDWAQLFRRFEGYLGTELFNDRATPLRYITIDRWASRQDFLQMKKRNVSAYRTLDTKCEALTTRERRIGEFDIPCAADKCGKDTLVRESLMRSSGARPPITDSANALGARECPPHTGIAGHLRPATLADVPNLLALERETPSAAHWPEDTYRRIFATDAPPRIALLFENSDRALQGFAMARIAGDECELENIAVGRKKQGQGIGTELVRGLIAAAHAEQASRIFLEVRESNTAARGLYEKCGFVITGRRPGYYTSPAEDAVLYALNGPATWANKS